MQILGRISIQPQQQFPNEIPRTHAKTDKVKKAFKSLSKYFFTKIKFSVQIKAKKVVRAWGEDWKLSRRSDKKANQWQQQNKRDRIINIFRDLF